MDSSFPAATAIARPRRRTAIYWVSAACTAALIAVPAWMLVANPAVLGGHPLLPGLLIAAAVVGVAWAVLLWRRRDTPRPRSLPTGHRCLGGADRRTGARGRAGVAQSVRLPARRGGGGRPQVRSHRHRNDHHHHHDARRRPGTHQGTGVLPGRAGGCTCLPGHPGPGRRRRVPGGHPEGAAGSQPAGCQPGPQRHGRTNPDITTWAVGGHSLGGVAASSFAPG